MGRAGEPRSATTAPDGTYVLDGLLDDGYTLTPSKPHLSFTPASRTIVVNGAEVTGQDFAVELFTVSGRVTHQGHGEGGVLLRVSPGSAAAITDATGRYAVPGVAGMITLTPSKAGRSFTPASRTVAVSSADVIGQDFTVATFTIRGRVTRNGQGQSGVTVTLHPGELTAVTGADGRYLFPDLVDGTYALVPSRAGWTFAPPLRVAAVSGADAADLDFAVVTHTVSGRVTRGGAGKAGVDLTLSPGDLTVTTGADGRYALPGVLPGSYTLTPGQPGLVFTPSSRSIVVCAEDLPNQDFEATEPRQCGPRSAWALPAAPRAAPCPSRSRSRRTVRA